MIDLTMKKDPQAELSTQENLIKSSIDGSIKFRINSTVFQKKQKLKNRIAR
jgi:hypothetical protein